MSRMNRIVSAQNDLHPIAKVEHFFALSSRAQELYQFLRGDLLLPEVWPFSDHGSFTSGGLSLGNVVFEVVQLAGAEDSGSEKASFQGIAFEPVGTAESMLAWLDKRSLGHSAPNPFKVMVDGSERVRAVRFGLEVPPNDASIFVCDYKFRDSVRDGRKIASRQLLRSGGGPLGIQALREIVITLADLKQGTDSWSSFLGCERLVSTGVFTFSEGPAIRLVQSPQEGIHEIVLEVAALADTKSYLESKGLLGSMSDGYLTIATSAIQGLRLSLTEN